MNEQMNEQLRTIKHYTAFGLNIASEFDLPLPYSPGSDYQAPLGSLTIQKGTIYTYPEEMKSVASFQYGLVGDDIVIQLPKIATFLLSDETILASAEEDSEPHLLERFLVSGALGFYLIKRKFLVLHGSSVVLGERAVCLIGDQGSGKSTTAAKLASLDYRVMCDDLIPLSSEGKNAPSVVIPGIPRLKLLPDAFEQLVGDTASAASLFDGVDKYQVDMGEALSVLELGSMYILCPQSGCDKVSVEQMTGMNKINQVIAHASVVKELYDYGEFFTHISRLLAHIPVYKIYRPAEGDSLQEVIEVILSKDAEISLLRQ